MPDPMPLTRPTEFSEQNGKTHITRHTDPDPSSAYSSSKKYNSSKDSNSSKSIKNKSDKNKKRRK